jgi:PAS domain-containing protein
MLPPHEIATALEAAEDHLTAQPLTPTCNWLFNASSEAVLIVDTASELIAQANPPAAHLLRTNCQELIGTPFAQVFAESSAPAIRRSLDDARSSGSSELGSLRVRGAATDLKARLSVARAAAASFFVVRLDAQGSTRTAAVALSAVLEAIDAAPTGFLITALDFEIEYANRGFLLMVGMRTEDDVRGTSLARWLRLSTADLVRLNRQRSQRQATSLITTTLLCFACDAQRRVELCAVPVPDGPDTCWGFALQLLPRLN